MANATNDWTAELVEAIPNDGNRYEVIDGELFVTPAPGSKHQAAVGELLLLLQAYSVQRELATHGFRQRIYGTDVTPLFSQMSSSCRL